VITTEQIDDENEKVLGGSELVAESRPGYLI
jgi:hypothetical protein